MIDNSSEKIAENAQGSSERLCLISLMDESTIKDPKSLGAQASSLLLISPDTKAPIAETKAPIIAETKSDLTQPNNPFQVKFLLSRGLSKDNSETGPYEDRPHEFLRRQCEFTDLTGAFLQRYQRELPSFKHADGSLTYFIPLHGITDRRLRNNDTDHIKYFRTTMHLNVPPDAHNLDQCLFRRGPRVEVSEAEFHREIEEEISGRMTLVANKGPLNFFTHGCFSGAGVTDADAVRLAMLTGTPTVTIDWRATQGPWYTLPFRYVVDYYSAVSQEPAFEKALDESLNAIEPSRVTLVSFSRGAAFNAAYMKHRYMEGLKAVNGHVMAHADLSTSAFRERVAGLNPITASSHATAVLGNRHDKVLFFSRWRIFGDRVGDANKSDIEAVNAAGARYVIDDVQRKGGNLNHYVNYNLIAGLLRNMSETRRSAITCDTTSPALELIPSRP